MWVEIERELYVDDLFTGGATTKELIEKKATTIEIFKQATLHMHECHSNGKELEIDEVTGSEDDLNNYAKQQLGVKSRECCLLGLKWDKSSDEIG